MRKAKILGRSYESLELSASGDRPPRRGFPFWTLAGLLLFSPLPFASLPAVWPPLYGVLLSLAVLLYVTQRWQQGRDIPIPPAALLIAMALVLLVSAWGYVQSLPGLFPNAQHPVWQQTRDLLALPNLPGALSIAPERSMRVATHYLTYLAFGLMAFWMCRRRRNRVWLFKAFIAGQAAYAAYGLLVFLSGNDTILWLPKTAYFDVLTSTFVNRNSYATYVGLGTLAALAWMLRYLRRLLTEDMEAKTRLRDFVETLTQRGWLLVIAILLCFLALLLTESRMGLVAFLAGATALLLGWSLRLPRGQPRTIGLVLLIVPVALLSLNLFLSGDQTAARFAHLFERGDDRFNVYPLMLEAIAERPWSGYGLGSFESAFRLVRDQSIGVLYDRGHNDYLELAMEIGWPATLALISAFVILLGAAMLRVVRQEDFELPLLFVAATVQIGLHSLVDFSMQMPAVVFAYGFLAGAAFGERAARHSFN